MISHNLNSQTQRAPAAPINARPAPITHAPEPQHHTVAPNNMPMPSARHRIPHFDAMPSSSAAAPRFRSPMEAIYAELAASPIAAVAQAGALIQIPRRLDAQAQAIVSNEFRALTLDHGQDTVGNDLPSWTPRRRADTMPRAQRIAAYVYHHLPYAAQPRAPGAHEPTPALFPRAMPAFIGRLGDGNNGGVGGPPVRPRGANGSGPPPVGPDSSGAGMGPPPPTSPIHHSLWPLWVAGGVAVACIGISTVCIGLSLLLTGAPGTGLAVAGGVICAVGIGLIGYGFHIKRKEDPATLMRLHFPQIPSVAIEALLWTTPVARRYPAMLSASQAAWTQTLSEPVLAALLDTLLRMDAPHTLVARMTANEFSVQDAHFLFNLRYVDNQSVEAYLDHYLAARAGAPDNASGADLENVMDANLIRASQEAILAFLEAHGPEQAPSPVWVQAQMAAIKMYMATRTEMEMPVGLRARALAALERPRLPVDFNGPLQDDPHFALLNGGSVGLGTLLALIWKFGDDIEAGGGRSAKADADNLRYSACVQLADCIEVDNHRVCGVGVAQRFISIVSGYSAAVPAEDPASAQPGDVLSALGEAFSSEIAEPNAADFAAFRISALAAADARWLPSRPELRRTFEAQLDIFIQITQDS